MRLIERLAAALVLAAAPLAAWAADGPAQLRDFVAKVHSASGSFAQSTLAQNKAQVPQTGHFAFKRPGKFRWEVQRPYEQLIVADGKRVLQYDPDLAQLTERGIDQSIGASPAAILFGSGSLDTSFELTPLPDDQGMQWLRAVPREADAGFRHMDIGFAGGLPARLMLLDVFGQTTRIDFSDIVANPALDDTQFQFTPPPGVDVVKMQ